MGDAPDPLGRQALFTPPARAAGDERLVGVRLRRQSEVPHPERGRRALFSAGGHTPVAADGLVERGANAGSAPGDATTKIQSDADGGAAVGADAREPGQGHGLPARLVRWGGTGGRTLRQVRIDCSTCGARQVVGLGRFASLHLPWFVVLPGRGYTRLLTCPACGRRSWLSASWPASTSAPAGAGAASRGGGVGEAGRPRAR